MIDALKTNNKKNLISTILDYAKSGLKVFPLIPNGKVPLLKGDWKNHATNDEGRIINWWNDNKNANIGVPCEQNDLFVIDIDVRDDRDGFESLKEFGITLPKTLTQKTPSGGTHYIYKLDGLDLGNRTNLIAGVDIRAKGGYIVISPSAVDGKSYSWTDNFNVKKIRSIKDGDSLNDDILKLLMIKDSKLFEKEYSNFELDETISQGHRNDSLFKYSCSLQAKGYDDEYIYKKVKEANQEKCDIPIPDKEVERLVLSSLKYPKGNRVKDGIDLHSFHKYNKEGQPVKVLDVPLTDYIKLNNSYFSIGGVPYVYHNGVYKNNIYDDETKTFLSSEQYLHKIIRNLTHDSVMDYNIRERIMKLLISDSMVNDSVMSRFINRYPDEYINFKNGMYDMNSGILLDHDPKYKSINQIPYTLDLDLIDNVTLEDIPNFYKFLSTTFNDKGNIEMFLQYLALSLTKKSPQSVLYIQGVAGSGKSLLLNFITELIGFENISNITIQSLGERFTNSRLFGKQLNIYADLPTNALEKGDYFKTVFGNDGITVEQKYKDAFTFIPYVKGIFSMNRIPSYVDEKSDGYYRRILIIKIKKKGEFIDDLQNKLKDEIPLIIPLLISKLKIVIDNAWNVFESRSSKLEKEILKIETDPVQAFITECTKKVESDSWSLVKDPPRTLVYSYYKTYCEENGRKELSRQKFYGELRERGFEEKKAGVVHFKGIKLLPFEGISNYDRKRFDV